MAIFRMNCKIYFIYGNNEVLGYICFTYHNLYFIKIYGCAIEYTHVCLRADKCAFTKYDFVIFGPLHLIIIKNQLIVIFSKSERFTCPIHLLISERKLNFYLLYNN